MNQRGKYAILAQHYSEYLPRVLNYMRLRTDDEALAQDLTARTFERALSRLHHLRDEGAFGGWLFAIARTEVAGYYRRRQPQLSLDSAAEYPAPGESAEGQVIRSEELRSLALALALLPEREQEIIRLKFIAGLSNRAIGKAMNLREGNVAVILYRALRKVRAQLESPVCDESEVVELIG